MKDLTDNRPKCLVILRGKTLLDWQLHALKKAGVSDIAIVTGYKRELLTNRGLVEFHNARWAETNMVTSLMCAQAWLQSEPCIVSYSDIFYHYTAVRSLISCQAALAVTYDPNWLSLWKRRFRDPLVDAESFSLTPERTLAEIGKRPQCVEDIHGQYMGLLRFEPEGWAEVKRIYAGLTSDQSEKMDMTSALQRVVEAQRMAVTAIPYSGEWGEVDSQSDLSILSISPRL
jgi:choline kinase